MMHGLQAANPGVSIPQDILQGFGTSGAQTQSQVDANTEDYITTPDFQSQVAAVRQAKPGLASRTLESVGAGNIAPTNSNKYLDASDSVKRHFLDIAARKHLNPDRLTAEAMRQGNQ